MQTNFYSVILFHKVIVLHIRLFHRILVKHRGWEVKFNVIIVFVCDNSFCKRKLQSHSLLNPYVGEWYCNLLHICWMLIFLFCNLKLKAFSNQLIVSYMCASQGKFIKGKLESFLSLILLSMLSLAFVWITHTEN